MTSNESNKTVYYFPENLGIYGDKIEQGEVLLCEFERVYKG